MLQGIAPRTCQMVTTDSLATITTAGYMNKNGQVLQGENLSPTDVINVIYNYSAATNSGTFGIFTPSFSSPLNTSVITLVQWTDAGNVLLPVVSGDVATFSGTTGQIADSNILGTNLVVKNAANTMAAGSSIVLAKVNGTETSNAVTASGIAGAITTSSLSTAGGGSYAITWTNTFISTTSSVLLTIAGGSNTTENVTLKLAPGAGTATLTIYNNTAATALNGTIIISYAVL
jgi:hypothetical protein